MRKLFLASNGAAAIEGMKMLFDDLSKVKIAYVITASKGVDDLRYLKWHKEAMDKIGIDYEEIDIDGKSEDELRVILNDKDAVYVEGGNTFCLLKAVRESGFDRVIKELIKKGLVYIGSSAGAYIACPTIEMSLWKSNQKEKFGLSDFSALVLVPFLIFVHYTEDQETMIKEKRLNSKYKIKVLKDGQAILVEGEEYKLVEV